MVRKGDTAKRTGRVVDVPVGEALLGRVVDPLGRPLDGRGPLKPTSGWPIEIIATGVVKAASERALHTGLKAIDSMIPIGWGQRELIIGDRQTGKTAIAIDTIINQRDTDVHCIYVAIGQKQSTVAQIVRTLEEYGAMSYTTVIAATASDPRPCSICPYAGTAMGEEFMFNGKHALVIMMTVQACCSISYHGFCSADLPEEAYPGTYSICTRLLERASKLSDDLGGGSRRPSLLLKQAGDVSAYIPTNVISITDGQIYLESDLFFAGQRPAVNAGLSVFRVGGSAQTIGYEKGRGRLRLDLASTELAPLPGSAQIWMKAPGNASAGQRLWSAEAGSI